MRGAILLKIILVIKKDLKGFKTFKVVEFYKDQYQNNYLVKYISDSYTSPIAGKSIVVAISKFNRWLPVQR